MADPAHTIAPPDLWAFARTLICDIWNLFGAPEDIARQLALTTRARALMLTWLRAGEAVLRHLLLIEAAALMDDLPPPTTTTRASSTRTARAVSQDPETPATWRLAFRAIPAHASGTTSRTHRAYTPTPSDPYANYFKDPKETARIRAAKAAWLTEMNALCRNSCSPARGGAVARSATEGASATPAVLHSAQPLAERAETLLRVFNAPALYARRLAFHLRRSAKLAHRMLRIPADIDRAVNRETATRFHDEAVRALNHDTS